MGASHVNTTIINNAASAIAEFMSEYQIYLNIFLVFVAVTLVIVFVMNAVKFSTAADNPMKRQAAIHGILVSGICLAILGSFGLVAGIMVAFLFS